MIQSSLLIFTWLNVLRLVTSQNTAPDQNQLVTLASIAQTTLREFAGCLL
jgi:hypothetical protein